MRLFAGDTELLNTLASMPFLDRLELAAGSGRSPAAVYQRIDRFAEAGLVNMVGHSNDLITPTRRDCLSTHGLRRLASEREVSIAELSRSAPVSEQWRRLILKRLDATAAIYRLSAAASEFAYPLGFQWFRASPMDAALELPDGRRIAVVRQGMTSDRTAFVKRIRRLRETPGYGAVLLLAPDETRLRHARRLIAGPPLITFLALQRDDALSGASVGIWRACSAWAGAGAHSCSAAWTNWACSPASRRRDIHGCRSPISASPPSRDATAPRSESRASAGAPNHVRPVTHSTGATSAASAHASCCATSSTRRRCTGGARC